MIGANRVDARQIRNRPAHTKHAVAPARAEPHSIGGGFEKPRVSFTATTWSIMRWFGTSFGTTRATAARASSKIGGEAAHPIQ